MRHAKSSWKTGLPDASRPLNARGRRDAPRMAQALDRRGLRPDHVLCSDAERTRETLAWLEDAWGADVEQTVLARLYHAGVGDLLDTIADAPDVPTLMVLGHNPGLEDLVEHLCGEPTPMPTAAVAVLAWPNERTWRDVGTVAGRATLTTHLRPKALDA